MVISYYSRKIIICVMFQTENKQYIIKKLIFVLILVLKENKII